MVRKLTSTPVTLALVLMTSTIAEPTLAGSVQSLESIQEAALTHAKRLADEQDLTITSIKTGRLDPRLRLTVCDEALDTFSQHNAPFSHRTTIGVRCNGNNPWTVYVPVTIATEVKVLILSRSVARGEILQRRDLKVAKQRFTRGGLAYFVDPNQVIGKQVTRNLAGGTVVLATMLAEPLVVKRGDTVPIVAILGGLSVTSTGEALGNGAVGDMIRLKNDRSGRTVEGRIQTDGSVAIQQALSLK